MKLNQRSLTGKRREIIDRGVCRFQSVLDEWPFPNRAAEEGRLSRCNQVFQERRAQVCTRVFNHFA